MNPLVEKVLARLGPKARQQAELELARTKHPDFAHLMSASARVVPSLAGEEALLAHDPYDVTGSNHTPAKRKETAKHPKAKNPRVVRTRNAGTWTEAQYWQRLRSSLRKMSMFWKPARAALIASRIPCKGPRGQKWAYLCSDCGKVYHRKEVHIDHITPCGKMTSYDHVGDFVRKLLPEDKAAFAVRCVTCHQSKTNAEREQRSLS